MPRILCFCRLISDVCKDYFIHFIIRTSFAFQTIFHVTYSITTLLSTYLKDII